MFCDWYIECCKAPLRAEGEERLQVQRNLVFVLDQALRLLHPVMPFVTEFIWDQLPRVRGQRVGAAHHGVLVRRGRARRLGRTRRRKRSFELLRAVVGAARSTRARYRRVAPRQELDVTVRARRRRGRACSPAQRGTSCAPWGALWALSVGAGDGGGEARGFGVCRGRRRPRGVRRPCRRPRRPRAAEAARLAKELAKAQRKELAGVERTLGNAGFVAKAAPAVIEKKRAQAAELTATIEQLKAQIADFA